MDASPNQPRPLRHPRRVRAARRALLPEDAHWLLDALRGSLCDPTRAKMLCALTAAELTVGDLAQAIGQSRSSTSQHLRVLRTLGVVRSRRRGRAVYNALADGPTAAAARRIVGVVTEVAASA
jgi:DNA-binding transcriptional ArsR family regulator